MKNKFTKAFTLVELIVVITILAVLATIGFISMTSYSVSSRDAVRTTDLKSITKAFEFQKTKDIKLPLPDKKVDISASGSIFQHQGLLSENILAQNNIHGGGKDPQTGEYFGYAVNKNLDKFQIITFLENQENVVKNNVFSEIYANNSNKFPKTSGDILGFILDENTNEVILQDVSLAEIDIENNLENYKVILDKTINNSGDLKKSFIHNFNNIASCKAILLNGKSYGSGIYSINPLGGDGNSFDVYCDMETAGGGWTRVVYNFGDSSANFDKYFMANYTNSGSISANLDNTLSSINPEIFSRTLDTQDAMLKAQVYAQEPVVEINNGNWDYDTVDCQGPLGHTSRTQGCNNHYGNDNYTSADAFNIAYYDGNKSIVPFYLIDHNYELCWSGKGFCDFEFFLR